MTTSTNTAHSETPWIAGLYATWSELSGAHVSVDSFIRELSTFRRSDLIEWAGTLLNLVSEPFGQSPEIQRELVDMCLDVGIRKRAAEILGGDGRNVIFHRRQLWLLLQFASIVCGEKGVPLTTLNDTFGRLCMIARDSLHSIELAQVSTDVTEKERLEWQMALLISVAEIMPDSNYLARAQALWFDSVTAPTVQKELARCGIHGNLDELFSSHVDISLTDAFFALVTIYKHLTACTKSRPITPIVMTVQDKWWGAVPLEDRSRIFNLLSVPIDKFAAHLFGTPRQSWATDFSSVMARPFIESQPGRFICPDLSYLRAFFLDGIFWLLDKALPDKEWGNAFGAMYEWYIKQLLHAATQWRVETQSMYFDKVTFKGTTDQVCDVLLLSATTAALFESKGTRLTTRQRSGISVDETRNAVTKSVGSSKSGIGQLAKNIARILRGDAVIAGDVVLDLGAKPDIIPVLVWYEEAASNPPTQRFLDDAFVERLKAEEVDPSRVSPLLLFSTSELELFEQCSHYLSPDVLLKQFADFVLNQPGDPRCTFLRYAYWVFAGKTVDKGYVGERADRLFESAKAEHARRGSTGSRDSRIIVEDLKTMPDLIPEEVPLAQQIAYHKSLARGNGQDPPPYDPEATVGDFWQAAREVISRRGYPGAPTNWQVMYGTQNMIRGRVVQEVGARLQGRGTGPRNQALDNSVFEPLATASAVAVGRRDYGFAIDLFQECFALAREFEENNHCQVHKGAMTFNVAVAYLRANDFAAAMHYFELAQIETQQTTGDIGWGIYDSNLFQQNFWQILDLYEQENPLPLYNTFWGVPFGSAAARHDWTHLTDHSKLLYVILNAERISYRRLREQPQMAVSESFGLSYWNLIADLTRLLETEIRNRGIGGGGLQAQVVHNIINSPIAGFHGIVHGAGSLSGHHYVNSPATFDTHFPAIRGIITNDAETRERRIAAAAYLAAVARNQVQHQVETTMIIFHDRAAAIFTAEVLLCLCRLDAWVA